MMSFVANASDIPIAMSPDECKKISPECWCFTPEALDVLAGEINKGQKCFNEVYEKGGYIENGMLANATQGEAWWQQQSFIVGSMVVTFSLGGIITYLIMSKNQ